MPGLVAELAHQSNLNLNDLQGISPPMYVPNEDLAQLILKTNQTLER